MPLQAHLLPPRSKQGGMAVFDHDEVPAREHLPSLDGLRGLAIAMVVVFHAGEGWTELTEVGRRGVDLFFVLSGFLITGILLRARGQPEMFRSFYARRVLRIFPVYFVYLASIACFLALFAPPEVSSSFQRAWPWYAVFLTNVKLALFFDNDVGSVQHLWTLAVEEQFYFVWPVLVASLPRRVLGWLISATIVGVPALRAWLEMRGADDAFETAFRISMLTWTRVDTLMFGAMLALLRASTETWRWTVRAAPVLGVLAISALALPLPAALDYTWIALLFAAAVASCVSLDERRRQLPLLHASALRYLGTVSYAVYVLHFLLTLVVVRWLRGAHVDGSAGFALTLAAVGSSALLLATLSQRFIERPALALKRYFPL